jgi:hypothetical protein
VPAAPAICDGWRPRFFNPSKHCRNSFIVEPRQGKTKEITVENKRRVASKYHFELRFSHRSCPGSPATLIGFQADGVDSSHLCRTVCRTVIDNKDFSNCGGLIKD